MIYGPRQLTYSQFNTRVNRLANALQRLGLRRGDNISILQYNYPETYESLFASFKGGLGAVPINFRLHPKEFAYIIDHSESRAVVISPEFNQSLEPMWR
jgi:acyl-CoA synthetase (AMP-forming)/AMP-acid ligase II